MKPYESFRGERSGFTLVELLVVISIIAILSSLVIAGLSIANERANEVQAKTFVVGCKDALEQYFTDTGTFPGFGMEADEDRNDFPVLWRALMHDGRVEYLEGIQKDKIVVEDPDSQEGYRPATQDELDDREVEKYVLDPWLNPYVYRCNLGLKPREWMENKKYDIYSLGPNGEDDTILGEEAENDDDIHP